MLKIISKYLLALFITLMILIAGLSYIILPLLANSKKEAYLPYVKGLSLEEGSSLLKDFNLKVFYTEYKEGYTPNEILSISPRAFTKVKKGRNIILKISGDKDDINIPDYINTSLRNTIINIDRIRLNIDTLIFEYSNTIKKDYIIDQYPKKNKVLKTNDEITLVVSLGVPPDYYIVPNLVNINLKIAKEIISKSGLLLGNIKYEFNNDFLNNTILEQNLTPEMKYSFPALIDLIVSTDKIKLNE